MADLQISDSFYVKSSLKDKYYVSFINEVKTHFEQSEQTVNNIYIVDDKLKYLFKVELEPLLTARTIYITCDESHKTIDYSQEVIRKLIELGVRKNDSLIAIGGGITQDIVAFISSILYRGIDWKFYPTTLLAQCDSCIGSKSSINFDQFKNLIGTFNPPSQIFIYLEFLRTLSQSEIRSGIGEMLHYYFTEGIDLALQIKNDFEKLLVNRSLLPYYIHNSLRIKKKIIELDEFDTSLRHIFNYGHTFGHAIEAITSYAIPHGQAISIGMDIANFISLHKGMITQVEFDEMHEVLHLNIPPFKLTDSNIDEYCQALARDKKNKGNMLGCILTRGAGKVEKVFVGIDAAFRQLLLSYSATYGR
ncbi:MAG: 3-dehydroquinate synthase [Chitinophagaceae bacterium]|nr:3-dehydroquinate synthase [Chitinophagaceae bacterium]MCA6459674.1 3-dehydroquinate synthase [Chitinophagaceae bacterium]MCA6464541.1 3-dehydroquinate synthase [Chitinophagaceae bacterium]